MAVSPLKQTYPWMEFCICTYEAEVKAENTNTQPILFHFFADYAVFGWQWSLSTTLVWSEIVPPSGQTSHPCVNLFIKDTHSLMKHKRDILILPLNTNPSDQ